MMEKSRKIFFWGKCGNPRIRLLTSASDFHHLCVSLHLSALSVLLPELSCLTVDDAVERAGAIGHQEWKEEDGRGEQMASNTPESESENL